MAFYIDEKHRQKKQQRVKLKIYLALAVFLFLIIGAGYLIIYSSFFQIAKIQANNGEEQNKEQLIQGLKEFFKTNNILVWNNKTEDFLKSNPQIADLSIKKNYFKQEIMIDFHNREKFGIWCGESDCFWFDKDGVIFEKAPKVEGEMIYLVNDSSQRPLSIGSQIIEKNLFENLRKIFEVLDKAELNIKTIYLENFDLQEVLVKPAIFSLPKIYFSLRFDPSFSLAAIEELKKTGLAKVEYFDFRVENRVYYKMK